MLGDNVRLGLVVPVPELTTEADVHLHTVAALVVVSRRGGGGLVLWRGGHWAESDGPSAGERHILLGEEGEVESSWRQLFL